MSDYSLMSPMRLWLEADSLGWRLTVDQLGGIDWQPKTPEPMPEELRCALKGRAAALRTLLGMLEQERPIRSLIR